MRIKNNGAVVESQPYINFKNAVSIVVDRANACMDVELPSFSGAYNDLTGKPTLGTAAAMASTDFATAAQGTDARTPVAHSHAATEITGTAVLTNDARLSDARTPLLHDHSGVYEPANTNIQSHVGAAHAPSNATAGADWNTNLANIPATFPPSTHNHDAAYEPKNANIQAHVAAAHAPSNAQANADITKAEIEAKLTGAITSHSHSGGSDPWTYLRLASDFPTTSATAVDITGLAFTPAANQRYEFVGRLMVRTGTATVGPRPGVAWATGLADGVAFIQQTSSATANVFANGNISASVLAPVGGVPTTTGSWPALIEGMAITGATPSGNIRLQLASETAGTTVTAKAGSFLKYRLIP